MISLKQAVANLRAVTAKRIELCEQRDAACGRAHELRVRLDKVQNAVDQAKALLGAAQADYAVTGDFEPVHAAMRAVAVAQAEADVAVKTIQPMIQQEEENGLKIDGQLLTTAYQQILPHKEAAAHLLSTSADVRLFLYLYRESGLLMTDEVLRERLEYSEDSYKAECEKAFEKLMANA